MASSPINKIIIVGPAHPYRGGIAAFNERMTLELGNAHVHTSIITYTMQYPSILFPGKTQFSDEKKPDNILISRRLNTLNPFNWLSVARKINKEAPQILILRYWMPFFAPCLTVLAKLCHAKVILLADNIIPHEKRLGDQFLTNILLKSVDAVMVLSKSVANDLVLWNNTKPVLYSPHPIFNQYGEAIDRTQACQLLKLNTHKKYILFFGFIREYKGLDLLLKAMTTLRQTQPDLELIVAGEFYGNETKYRDIVQNLGIESVCHFYNNFIPDDEIKNFFSVADALILPYKSATQSGVTQIAYHFECPMIATKVGGLSEYIEDYNQGLLCEISPESIAQSIDLFYTQELENNIKNNIKNTKKIYSWQTFVNNLINFCKELVIVKNQ